MTGAAEESQAAPAPIWRRRTVWTAVAFGTIGLLLLALMVYFVVRPESDWVMVLALALCAAAVGARLWALRPRRPE